MITIRGDNRVYDVEEQPIQNLDINQPQIRVKGANNFGCTQSPTSTKRSGSIRAKHCVMLKIWHDRQYTTGLS